jgi:hypothetical protein
VKGERVRGKEGHMKKGKKAGNQVGEISKSTGLVYD